MSGPPSGIITFLFTDIEESTRHFERDEQTMLAAVKEHDLLIRTVVGAHEGFVFKTVGDAFMVAFSQPLSAVLSAVEIQRALQSQSPSSSALRVRVRMTVHTGSAELRDSDYFGTALSRANRILSLAAGGQILISQSTRDILAEALPSDFTLLDLHNHRLKDLTRPEHLYQVATQGIEKNFPPLQSLDKLPNNLPLPLTSFIGRNSEMEFVRDAVARQRLVTVTGPGGSGKTRLALQAAATMLADFPDGVWFIDLGTILDGELIPQTIATVLGVSEEPGHDLLASIRLHLADTTTLLVLDNCEHLLKAVAGAVSHLIGGCQRLRILATSREDLAIYGERQFRLPCLPTPDKNSKETAAAIISNESVQLFVDRGTSVASDFHLTDSNAGAVAEICRKLDGIPLAIEFAAANLDTMSPGQMVRRLSDFFEMLNRGNRNVAERHQTLHNAISWSYGLLDDPMKRVLRRMSIFRGGWSLEAAEQVCIGTDLEIEEITPILGQLVRKSLVLRETGVDDNPRYRLLESVRQFGAEQLLLEDEGYDTSVRHLEVCLHRAESLSPELKGPNQREALDLVEEDLDNFRAAMAYPEMIEERLRIGIGIHWYWMTRSRFTEGVSIISRLTNIYKKMDSDLRARALNILAVFQWAQGEFADAHKNFDAALVSFRKLGDRSSEAMTLNNLGMLEARQQNLGIAMDYFESAHNIYLELGLERRAIQVIDNLGALCIETGNYERAIAYLGESEQYFRANNSQYDLARTLSNLGLALYRCGLYADAQKRETESLTLRLALKDVTGTAMGLIHLGTILIYTGHEMVGLQALGCSQQLIESDKVHLTVPEKAAIEEALKQSESSIGTAARDLYLAAGRVMRPDEVFQFAQGI
ncbi:MAG: tetratricopeptide repeat protein [Chthonomonadales bacterium]